MASQIKQLLEARRQARAEYHSGYRPADVEYWATRTSARVPQAMAKAAWPIVKIDASRRIVTGIAACEEVDKSGEIFDYTSSKPNVERWSAEMHADTDGKSFGNVREMHGPHAAGRVESIDFDDANKLIVVSVKVIDDSTWQKVEDGVLTGFSIGGSYGKKWKDQVDGQDVTRYTAQPAEISLVDRPCMPSAKFSEILKFSKLASLRKSRPAPPARRVAPPPKKVPPQPVRKRRPALPLSMGAAVWAAVKRARRQEERLAKIMQQGEALREFLIPNPVLRARFMHRPRRIG